MGVFRFMYNRPVESRGDAVADLEFDRAQLETFLEHIPVGVIVVDASGETILRMNAAAERLLHVPASAGIDAHSRYRGRHPDGRVYERHEWPLSRTLATGETVRGEVVRLELDDGTERSISITSAPVRSGGAVTAGVVVLDDVTEQERRERAEREFITNAAHELQTPLAAITSAVEVLQAGAKEHAADRDRFLEHVEESTRRLIRLTRALLVLARAQTRQEDPRRELLNATDVLETVASSFPQAEIDVGANADVAVLANRPLLEQALVSLTQNALKHTLGPVALRARRSGTNVALDVIDSGRGISKDDQDRIFDRFYRSKGAADGDGFGLGLAIVREVVAALDGELAVDSDDGGTRVSILLPGARVRHS